MGSSYVVFNGLGFWANDTSLQVWLRLMIDEARRRAVCDQPWLADAAELWGVQLHMVSGCISPSLDEIATDHERKDVLLALANSVRRALTAEGLFLSAKQLNAMELPGVRWTGPAPAAEFLAVGQCFEDLIRGVRSEGTPRPLLFIDEDPLRGAQSSTDG